MYRRHAIERVLSIFIITAMILSGMSLPWSGVQQEAYAKNKGVKNEAQKQACDAIVQSKTPAGYSDELGDGSVFRGGNTRTAQGASNPLDDDINDFATPLPYGDTYIDTSKLNWDNPDGFLIDIKDSRFKWVYKGPTVPEELKDSAGHAPTNKPLDPNKTISDYSNGISGHMIAYVGELNSYLDNIQDASKPNGNVNVIEPDTGVPYLYRITYFNAVTLSNGTRGNLVLTMKKVELETSINVSATNPVTLKDTTGKAYSYDKAIIAIQKPNSLGINLDFKDSEGNWVNEYETVAIPKDDVSPIVKAANKPTTLLAEGTWIKDKMIRHAAGGAYDLDIEVVDADMNPVNGTISYAAHDVDFASYQNVWGHPVDGDDKYKYAEGLAILDGSKSYALVPEYRHDGDGKTLATGWVPVKPTEVDKTTGLLPDGSAPLNVEAGTGPHADGVRFSARGTTKIRDKNGLFKDAPFSATQVVVANGQGYTGSTAPISSKKLSEYTINDNTKKLYYTRLKAAGYSVGNSWKNVTADMLYDYLGDASWKVERQDPDAANGVAVFDTGFAVLLDSKKSSLQWTGSRQSGAGINTTLFDSSLYTYVETSHGTGGGIYLEKYNLDNGCTAVMDEGTVTMGRHADSTVTAVPEKGYRVNRILIGDTNYGFGSNVSGLRDYTEYVIDGNDIKVNGNVVGKFNGSPLELEEFPDLKTGVVELDGFYFDVNGDRQSTDRDKKIRIERNADGTVDVTLPDIDNPMHVHADFGADYYFYKVWKGGTPVELNLTASPAGIYPTAVEDIPVPTGELDEDGKAKYQSVDFDINGNKYTAKNGKYKDMDLTGVVFKLAANNTLEYIETDSNTGEETLAIRPNVVLLGDKFVLYKTDSDTGVQTVEKEYPITMENRVADWESSVAKNFKVNNTADYTKDGYVTQINKDDGSIVWKIKYPSEGVESLNWPALPVEEEPSSDNHDASNHHERNYWFVIEEVPTWSTEGYSNENADIPGKEDAAYYGGYENAIWYAATVADRTNGNELVHVDYEHGNAYMSVFKDGGEITNVPSIIVRGKKEWDDYNNAYEYRKDIWLHIDATVGGKPIPDVLPAQKVAFNASGDGLIKTWGNKKSYTTGVSSVKVVATAKKVPSNAKKQPDGSYIYKNTTYWVNELMSEDAEGNAYKYSIRETLDRDGTKPVEKNDPTAGLFGYTSEDEAEWNELKAVKEDGNFSGKDTGKIDEQTVDRYNGDVKNTLETVEFEVTKVWKDANNKDDTRPEEGAVTYTIKKQSGDNAEAVVSSLPVANSVTQGSTDLTSEYKNGKITVKTTGADGVTVKFSNLPKTDSKGNVITYTVEETPISGYKTEYSGDMENGYTVTNTLKTEVYVEKEWEDANNQDGVRPQTVKFILKKGTETVGTINLSEGTNWKGKFSDLDKYDENNAEISYTVEEDTTDLSAAGYSSSDTTGAGTESDPYIITNSREPEQIIIKATKVWNDEEYNPGDKYNIHFAANFDLYADSAEGVKFVERKTVPENATGDDLTVTWTVDKYRDGGQKINYSVVEDKEPKRPYSVEVTGDAESGFIVTNTYPPDKDYIIVTRTITYTYNTPDGQTASETVVQKVRYYRTPIEYTEDGSNVDKWTPWIIDDDYDDKDISGVDSPNIEGWVVNSDSVPEWDVEFNNGIPQDAFVNVVYTPLPPLGKDKVTYGPKGQPQTGKPTFEMQTKKTPSGSDNDIVKYELLDEKGTPVASGTVTAYDSETGKEVGTYTLNDDGSITFTPNDSEYVGNPKPVTIKGTDSHGKSATATYTPHLVDNTETVKRTIHYRYLTKDGSEASTDVVQTVTFTDGVVDPVTGKVTFPYTPEKPMAQVDSDEIEGYTVDRESVEQITVGPDDDDIEEVVIYSPKGISSKSDETYGLKGQPQKGEPTFKMETSKLPDGSDNALTIKLIDPNTGNPTDSKTVNAKDNNGKTIGTYTLNEDGSVTFQPNADFVGDPVPLQLEATDKFGTKTDAEYTPHVVNPEKKGTATRTIHYRYLTEDGDEVTDDTIQSITLYKHPKSVDPKTGDVIEWGDWEPGTFPAVENPDDEVDGRLWFTDDSVDKRTVKEPGIAPDEYVIYKKIPYTVKYLDGSHGKSDGKGNQKDEEYNNDVTGGNGVKPNKGYKFTGKYTYVIKDHSGKVIGTGETDDPTSLKITGNIEFTPVYKKLPTTIYVDPATGRTIQKTLPFLDDNTEPKPPKNPKRKGYKFTGWERISEYDENGELVNIRYEAKWEKVDESSDDSESNKTNGVNTGDNTYILIDIAVFLSAALAIFLMIRRRRKYNR